MLEHWIRLLLLTKADGYGYEIRRELVARGVPVDASAMYRLLRRLEHEGDVRSRWVASSGGPRRRVYALTDKGRRVLDAAVTVAEVERSSIDAFLREHAAAVGTVAP